MRLGLAAPVNKSGAGLRLGAGWRLAAALLLLFLTAACGGPGRGPDGAGSPAPGPTPGPGPAPTPANRQQITRGAETGGAPAYDPRAHFGREGTLGEVVDASPRGADTAAEIQALRRDFNALRGAAAPDTGRTGKNLLRNLQGSELEMQGGKDGFSYAQWDTETDKLRIELDWRFAPNASKEMRRVAGLAVKAWSRRIAAYDDDNNEDTEYSNTIDRRLPFESTLADGTLVLGFIERNIETDGLRVFIFTSEELTAAGFVIPRFIQIDDTGTGLPYAGNLTITDAGNFEDALSSTIIGVEQGLAINRLAGIFGHELGHILGITALPAFQEHVEPCPDDPSAQCFTGENAVRVNGGQPVRLGTGLPDADPALEEEQGPHHISNCESLLSYCRHDPDGNPATRDGVQVPGPLDFAILEDLGYTILLAAEGAEHGGTGWSAWGEEAAWGVGVLHVIEFHEARVWEDRFEIESDHFGNAPTDGLVASYENVQTLRWHGVFLGVHYDDSDRSAIPLPLVGDALLEIILAAQRGEMVLSELRRVTGGGTAPNAVRETRYLIQLDPNDSDGNRFISYPTDPADVQGSFYGAQHEEAAGTVNDPDNHLQGAFGGRREGAPPPAGGDDDPTGPTEPPPLEFLFETPAGGTAVPIPPGSGFTSANDWFADRVDDLLAPDAWVQCAGQAPGVGCTYVFNPVRGPETGEAPDLDLTADSRTRRVLRRIEHLDTPGPAVNYDYGTINEQGTETAVQAILGVDDASLFGWWEQWDSPVERRFGTVVGGYYNDRPYHDYAGPRAAEGNGFMAGPAVTLNWAGAFIGVDIREEVDTFGNTIIGDARIAINTRDVADYRNAQMENPELRIPEIRVEAELESFVTVRIDALHDIIEDEAFREDALNAIPARITGQDNSYQSSGGGQSLQGFFYGRNLAETAGTIVDSNADVMGAYSASR